MDYPKIFDYVVNLNSQNSPDQDFYNNIISFQDKHFIPAIRYSSALLLKWFSRIKQPLNILEIGFGSGASGLFIHRGFSGYQNFISLEKDHKRFLRGQKLLEHLNIDTIQLFYKDAFDFLEQNQLKFDFVFLDAVKRHYYLYLPLIKKILNPGGIFICDNVLFGGRVVEDNVEKKYYNGVQFLQKFNRMLADDPELESLFLPLDDGLSFSLKK